jgi:hypothetical protein
MKPFVIGCCRCMRMMSIEGKPLGKRVTHGGIMQMPELLEHLKNLDGNPKLASFENKSTAEAAAMNHGWEVVLGDHRCPECAAFEQQLQQAEIDAKSPYAGMVAREGFCMEWPFPATRFGEPDPLGTQLP